MSARSFLRSVLGSGVELIPVDAPIFCARAVRNRMTTGFLHADVRIPISRLFYSPDHIADAADHEQWKTLFVHSVRTLDASDSQRYPRGPVVIRASVDPGPFLCRHRGLCCCLWHPGRQ